MSRNKRILAASLALLFLSQVVAPTAAWALSSGPSQPEVEGFTPASATNMVDLFTGDMSYNIPLLDVEGYPVNLAYNAGVGMDQEASWVGLGWNLSAGQVERNMRGIPDDFRGDEIVRHLSMKPNRTVGVNFNMGFQLFSTPVIGANLSLGASPSFNTYNGFAQDLTVNFSLRSARESKPSFNGGLGLTSSSNGALRVTPTVGFDSGQRKIDKYNSSAGINFGVTLDSRQGLTNLSFGTSMEVSRKIAPKESIRTSSGHGSSFDIGSPTYSPQIGLPMVSRNMSFSYTLGAATQGGHPNMTLGGFFSEQKLATKIRRTPAYGYLHLHAGQSVDAAQLDHNREKDGPYSGDRPAFGIASLTNDVFTVSAQGIGGSYRPFRSEVGHVFDPSNGSISSGGSGGLDVGSGMLAHGGARIMVNYSLSRSGRWSLGTNQAGQRLRYNGIPDRADLEAVYFREANEATVEQDSSIWTGMQRDQAVRFTLPSIGAYANRLDASLSNGTNTTGLPTRNYRSKREPRGQLFSYLTAADAGHFALSQPINHAANVVKPHHMSEVTVLDQQGGRHVFGIPAYNVSQADVEFNVEDRPVEASLGLVTYTSADNSTANSSGRDEYYSRTETPPYAYAFLLTAMLSHDYSDADDIRGPSAGDLGSYTKFEYSKVHDAFPWRTPAVAQAPAGAYQGKGRFIEGSPTSGMDDKCTYSFGKKEVYYLKHIITRNYIAVFHHEYEPTVDPNDTERLDGLGVLESGLKSNSQKLHKLDKISLYERHSYEANQATAVPIKEVHFRYDYTLCPGTPNSAAPGGGKLTLRRVFFTYGASKMGVTAPYVFTYNESNPAYNAAAQDRWGNYKAEQASLQNDDFPYTPQEAGIADGHAQAWKLWRINLPSGGLIEVNYEADDYASVQDRSAMQMMKVLAITDDASIPTDLASITASVLEPDPTVSDCPGNQFLWFDLPDDPGVTNAEIQERLIDGIDKLYFRFRIKIKGEHTEPEAEYVSGYAQRPASCGVVMDGNNRIGYVELDDVPIDDDTGMETSPIYRAAIEFLRVNHPQWMAPDGTQQPDDGAEGDMGNSYLMSVVSSSTTFMTGMVNFFLGPNKEIHVAHVNNGYCHEAIMGQSYIRLNHPLRAKKGGGYRVSRVAMTDRWNAMETAETDRVYTYAQDYTYGDEDGSWGVAAFEPMMGADENPFRKPVYYKESRTLSPDERFYQEEPFGECFFPSPVVGYSRVEVVDVVDANVQATQGTGRVVHEFYTARDFPTITGRTGILPARRSNKPNLLSLLGIKKVDHMHGTQGFVVETNDMHGKPKRTAAYPEGSDIEVSYVEYRYASRAFGTASRVVSTEQTIDPQGNVSVAEIGRDYEFVADTREFTSIARSGGADVKFELLYSAVLGIPIPLVLPKGSMESTAFRTGVFVKKIHRFGRLRETVKMENGSRVSTENLAYDAITGQVLVTRTANDFKDPIYSMTFPAYWHYPGMAPAYRNIGATISATVDGNSRFNHPLAHKLFTPGDELALWHGATPMRAWVDRVTGNTVTLTKRTVEDVPATDYRVTVVRSGHRNMPGVPMMQLTTLSNPLDGLDGNVYANIVNANAVEFGTNWPTECECLDYGPGVTPLNEWVINRKGVWRLSKEHAWLTDRTRSVTNANTNIRRDGVYASFDPYYKVANGLWEKDETGWTTTRTVTLYSNNGQELENHDALNIYSSVHIGYRGTLVKSVAKNASYRENGFEGFEDSYEAQCADRHFKLQIPEGALVEDDAHTGRRSVRITSTESTRLVSTAPPCEVAACKSGFAINETGTAIAIYSTFSTSPIVVALPITGDVQFIPTSGGLTIQATGSWTAQLTITDESGCTQTKIVSYP